jgi:hypothetical protein
VLFGPVKPVKLSRRRICGLPDQSPVDIGADDGLIDALAGQNHHLSIDVGGLEIRYQGLRNRDR